MILNRFHINVLIRVSLIVLSSVVLAIVLQHLERGYYLTLAGLIFLTFFQSYMLVILVNKTNNDLEIFFSSVRDTDTSVRFSKNETDSSFRKLHDEMDSLNTIIRIARIENERTSHFLKNVVDHVDVGLLSFDMEGKIGIYNRTARKYLNVPHPGQYLKPGSITDGIFNIINTIKPGQEVLHKIKMNNHVQSILIKATEFSFESNRIKLVSFQDITAELEKKELESWKRLIRVLTHEIMNSISPVTSLSKVISGYFKKDDSGTPLPARGIDQKIVSKTISGLSTIEETGKGLLEFVDRYRSLTMLPEPDFKRFSVNSLFSKCKILMEANISENIKISTRVFPENLMLEADDSQVEQVLINLIKNATEALDDVKYGIICLSAFHSDNCTVIQVEDNGSGIQGDIIEDIFVPFYTTKKNGSGIGLSLSKQIMQNHDGTISVTSNPGKGSKFTLKFNE